MKEPQQLPQQSRNTSGGVVAEREPRAVLVSERRAVWTKPAAVELEPADSLAAVGDPIWDHANGTRWTPDLVHCRLLEASETVCRLPSARARGFLSLLGNISQDAEEPDQMVRRAPAPRQI